MVLRQARGDQRWRGTPSSCTRMTRPTPRMPPRQDTASCDEHADELTAANAMLVAYALTPRDMADVDPRQRDHGRTVRRLP